MKIEDLGIIPINASQEDLGIIPIKEDLGVLPIKEDLGIIPVIEDLGIIPITVKPVKRPTDILMGKSDPIQLKRAQVFGKFREEAGAGVGAQAKDFITTGYKLGKFGLNFAKAIGATAGHALTGEPFNDETLKAWQEVKQSGDEAPLDELSDAATVAAIVYGGYHGVKSVPEIFNQLKGSNLLRKPIRERGLVNLSDNQLMEMFQGLPKNLQKQAAVNNPRIRKILQLLPEEKAALPSGIVKNTGKTLAESIETARNPINPSRLEPQNKLAQFAKSRFEAGKISNVEYNELMVSAQKSTGQIPVIEKDLSIEARKFTSAEEFVKDKTNAYHGTPNKEFKEFKLGVGNNTENETNSLGIWVTNEESAAKFFSNKIEPSFMGIGGGSKDVGGTVMPVSIQLKNPKIYTSTKGMESILEDIKKLEKEKPSPLNTSPSFNSNEKERLQLVEKRKKISKKISQLKKEYQRDAFEHFMDDRDQFATYIKKGAKWEERYVAEKIPETNKQFIEYLKAQGHDGIIIKGTEYDAKDSGVDTIDQTVAFNPKDVLTKSQLTDIWNKAQKDGVSLTSAEKADLEGTGKIDYRQPSAGEIRKALSSGAKKVINKPKKEMSLYKPAMDKIKDLKDGLIYVFGTKEERMQVIAKDPIKGKKLYDWQRRMETNLSSISKMTEVRNKAIFKDGKGANIPKIHDIIRGLTTVGGEVIGGVNQPAGILKNKIMRIGEELGDGRFVGKELPDGSFQLYRHLNTFREYDKMITENPKTKKVFDAFLAMDEAIEKTKLDIEIPAFARKVLKAQYGIESSHIEGYEWVPSIKAPERFLAKVGNLFKSKTPKGELYKTGALAEMELENKNLLQTLTQRQIEFSSANLYNNLIGDVLSLVVEPIGSEGVKRGYLKIDLNKPVLKKVIDLKKDVLLANGINVEKISEYQYPAGIEKEFNIRKKTELGEKAAFLREMADKTIGYIAANYLIKPSTAIRNLSGGFVQSSLQTLTHLNLALLGEGFTAFNNDIKAYKRALNPDVIKELPKEMLGLNYYSEVLGDVQVFNKALIPFGAIETYWKRWSFDSNLSTFAEKAYMAGVKAGEVKPQDKMKFIKDFRENYFSDVFDELADKAHSVTFDYGNKPWILEKMDNFLGKGIMLYPNYIYHKYRMYAEYSPLGLITANKSNFKVKLAKAMAGMEIGGLMLAYTNKLADDRKERLKSLEAKRLPYEFDTTGRIKFYADEEMERWVRVYDLPYIGDMLYMREIMGKRATVQDWLGDSIAMGPIFHAVSAAIGLRSKYTRGRSTSAVLGGQAAGFIPFGAYLRYMRILADPIKRKTFSKDYSAFENFINPIVDVIPGVSQELDPKLRRLGHRQTELKKFDIPAESMKMLFLNVRSIDKKEFQEYFNEQQRAKKPQARRKAAMRRWRPKRPTRPRRRQYYE